MIVVSFTSWKARIGNVKRVVKSILNNTVKPDRVYLNLSKEEFGDESNLPPDLVELFNSDESLVFNWCDGNTKQFKKVLPVLQYLEDEDIVIATDDDIIFPDDFIENRLKQFGEHGGRHPISSAFKKCHIGDTYVVSTPVIFKAKMMRGWEKLVDDTVMATGNDDRTYLYLFWLNGYTTRPTSRYSKRGLDTHFGINPAKPLKGSYIVGDMFDEAVCVKVKELTGGTIENSFGCLLKMSSGDTPSVQENIQPASYKKSTKHDVVIPWGHSGIASNVMTCGERLEIEYVVASLKRYCSSWLGRIFVVGDEPPASIKDDTIHLEAPNPYTHCKDANIIYRIMCAIYNVPDLTDDFVKISDDQVLTMETSWEDLTPRIVRRYSDWTEQQWLRNRDMDAWHKGLYITLHHFDLTKCSFWEPHIASPINKHRWIEMCNKYNWEKSVGCIDMTLYYNFIEQPAVEQFDHLHLSRREAKNMLNTLKIKDIPRHLSWTDAAFSEKKFRDILEKICYD